MKAKIISISKKHEMRLENKEVIESKVNEKKEAFIKRAREFAKKEFDSPLEVEELTAKFYEGKTLEQLKKTKAASTGLLAEVLGQAIQNVEKPQLSEETKANVAKAVQDVAPKMDAPVQTDKPKVVSPAAANKAKAVEAKAAEKLKKDAEKAGLKAKKDAEKAAKPPVVKMTLEEVQAAAAIAKENVGRKVTFQPQNTIMSIEGVVKSVWIDKRVPLAMYAIIAEDNKKYNKIIDSKNLMFGEKAPDLKVEAKAKKEAEKAEAKLKTDAEKAEKLATKQKAAEEKLAAKVKAAEPKAQIEPIDPAQLSTKI